MSESPSVRRFVGEIFLFGGKKMGEFKKVTKQKGGVGCEMFLEGSTFGGVNI